MESVYLDARSKFYAKYAGQWLEMTLLAQGDVIRINASEFVSPDFRPRDESVTSLSDVDCIVGRSQEAVYRVLSKMVAGDKENQSPMWFTRIGYEEDRFTFP